MRTTRHCNSRLYFLHKSITSLRKWYNTSLETFRKVKQQSKPIFLERINCYTKQAKFIIDDASSHLGIAPQHKITADMIQQEEEEISLADFIFCPSPEVKKSGVAELRYD